MVPSGTMNVYAVGTSTKGDTRVVSATFRPDLRGDLPTGRNPRVHTSTYPGADPRFVRTLRAPVRVLARPIRRQLASQRGAPRYRGRWFSLLQEPRCCEVLRYRHWGALPGALRDRLDLATRFRTFAAERRGQHPSSRIWCGRPGHWPGLVGSRRHQIPRLETLFRRRVEAPIGRRWAPYYCLAPGRGAPSRAACLGL
jgi:hypothetical protein